MGRGFLHEGHGNLIRTHPGGEKIAVRRKYRSKGFYFTAVDRRVSRGASCAHLGGSGREGVVDIHPDRVFAVPLGVVNRHTIIYGNIAAV